MSAVATPKLPPHAPQAGVWRKILGPFYVTGIFWFRIHRWGVEALPPWLIGIAISLFTSFFWVALRNIRAAVASNLEAVLGPCGFWERQRRIFRTLHTYAWCLSERYENLNGERRPEVGLSGQDHWDAVTREPHGFILLTAHFGSWEAASFLPSAMTGRKVHVVREGETDPKAQEFIRELIEKQGAGGYVTHFADHDPSLGMKLLDALREGHIVALQGDRPRSWGRPIEARLFGRPFPLPVGPATLARAAGVPLVPVFVERLGRLAYRCEVRPPIQVDRAGDRDAAIRQAVDAFSKELEAAIRARPYQWFCFRKVW
ncbi:MAG TPA: lysophospholipid acyltransferase family protein [Thermoanaerobaculia bacterium]|nr:lysophospholipid acyltransferase family protein [Thermoanaerobaculia bacterium]